MSRKTLIILSIGIAISLFIVSVFLNVAFDAVTPEPHSETINDGMGNNKRIVVWKYPPNYKYSKAISEFCYALSIGIIVFLAIESTLHKAESKASEKQLGKVISELKAVEDNIKINVFSGVLNRFIPPELFTILREDILKKDIIRKNAVWEYEITEVNSCYKLNQMITHTLHNLGNSVKKEPLDLLTQQNSNHKTYFEYYKVEKKDGTTIKEYNKNTINQITKGILNGLIINETIDIEPDQEVTVTFQICTEYCSKFVVDVHYSNYSCINFELRIRKPNDCDIQVIPTFTQKLSRSSAVGDGDDKMYFKPINGILLGQAIIFLIEPKQNLQNV